MSEGRRTAGLERLKGFAPDGAPDGVMEGSGATNGKPTLCENCEQREPALLVASPTKLGKAGLPLAVWVCRACAPKRARRKTKHRRATTDYHEKVEEILYRQAGATASQVARWLVLMTDDFDGRPDPCGSALEAAYRALRTMREAGVAEAIAIRRKWLGKKSGVAGSGRREDFYRLNKDGDGVVEGGVLANVDGNAAKKGYARPWFGGAIEHAAHRCDVMLLFAEQASAWGVELDPFSAYGETHPGFPLIGYELPRVDAAGVEKPARENASHTYERVVPDGAFVAVFSDAEGLPGDGSGREQNSPGDPDDRLDFDGTYDDDDDEAGSYEESYEDTGEEIFA